MKYCPTCGSDKLVQKIPEHDFLPRFVCDNCDIIHYQNPIMVVGCIVLHEGKILLAKRGISPRKGYWNLPCGFLEMNERIESGAKREVLEETGIDVEIVRLHTVYDVLPAGQGYLIFLAKALHTNFTLTHESTEIAFFDLDKIPWKDIAFSANTFALKKYLEHGSSPEQIVHLGAHK